MASTPRTPRTALIQAVVTEHERTPMSGWIGLVLAIIAGLVALWFWGSTTTRGFILAALFGVVALILLKGVRVLQLNDALVLMFLGAYRGSVRSPGFIWVNPLLSTHRISMKVQNFSTPMLKVNDKAGNPIEVAATVVWQVGDTARGLLAVTDLHGYIVNQTDMALREVASSFPYDSQVETEVTLRGHLARVSQLLGENVQEHVEIAGVRIIEAKFTHLAYAPEIASIMLRRQQATAVVQARETMVEGALGMVRLALAEIDARGIAKFDDRERAALITNMLTVLLSESAAQPVVAQVKPH